MANVIEFNEFVAASDGAHTDLRCWLCQKSTPPRTMFCHYCGTIQPVRNIDHFARLGLERRVDVDLELLERHYAALKLTLDPGRFATRGIGERNHASKQLEALNDAFDTLRDPMRRGRYWLELHEKNYNPDAPTANPIIAELGSELAAASAPSEYDRIAQKAGQAMEDGIISLLQALRGDNWQQAGATLLELDGLGAIIDGTRARRANLTDSGGKSFDLASVK